MLAVGTWAKLKMPFQVVLITSSLVLFTYVIWLHDTEIGARHSDWHLSLKWLVVLVYQPTAALAPNYIIVARWQHSCPLSSLSGFTSLSSVVPVKQKCVSGAVWKPVLNIATVKCLKKKSTVWTSPQCPGSSWTNCERRNDRVCVQISLWPDRNTSNVPNCNCQVSEPLAPFDAE